MGRSLSTERYTLAVVFEYPEKWYVWQDFGSRCAG
jgi:hypothetical protein